MPLMPLHVQIKADTTQTTFDIHNFDPEVRASHDSNVGPKYNYVVLSHGKYDGPTQVRVFMNCEEVVALYDTLTPIVENFRAQLAPIGVESPSKVCSDAPEVTTL